MPDKTQIAIADDQHLFRKGIVSLLKDTDHFKVMIEAINVKELMKQLKIKKPHVLLLSYKLHISNGLETVEVIKKRHPGLKILILALSEKESIIPTQAENGANGFLFKGATAEMMIKAIHAIRKEEYYFDKVFSKEMLKSILTKKRNRLSKTSVLSFRHKQIIKLIYKGFTNKQIGEELFLSHRTVDGHRAKLMRIIQAKNISGIISYAIKNKLTK
jgi:DNA-binding NarL/FixJ family response regulator